MEDPVQRIVEATTARKTSANIWTARCPAHDDRNASLSISRGDDGRALLHCHAGCSPMSVVAAAGLRMRDLFVPKTHNGNGHNGNGKNHATNHATSIAYDYVNAAGELLFQVVRMVPKDFRQRRPDGKGGWIWQMGDTPRVLYRLPELLAADPADPVFIVEGEKDVDNLRKLGLTATCNPGGAGKWSKLSDDSALEGRNVVIISDKDDAGRKHAADVSSRLQGRAASIRTIELPGGAVKDASDWISAGGTAEKLLELISAPASDPALETSDSDDMVPLGQRDPASGKLVLSPRRTLPTAEAFIGDHYHHADGATLIDYAGVFMRWRGNRYVQVDDESIRQQIQPWLHDALRYITNPRTGEHQLVPFESNPGTVKSALDSIRTHIHVDPEIPIPSWRAGYDAPCDASEIVSCLSANLHIPTRRARAPSPALLNISALAFDYHENAEPPVAWLEFLDRVWGGDIEQIRTLQEWFGYCLTADTRQQKMLLMVGPKRSGKGTIARVLNRLIGPANVSAPTTGSLAGNFGLQPLIGKSLAIVSDARFSGENIQTVVERLLCISGEDSLTIDRKFLGSVTMKLPTRFMFLTNELPRMNDASGALAGRFVILRMTESFYGREDISLTPRLLAELPGILLWALEGWERLNDRGHFIQPQAVADAVQDLEDLASPVMAFVRDCCEVGREYRVWVDDLYKAWRSWCEQEGRAIATTKQVFGRDLQASSPGVTTHKATGGVRFYSGIKLVGQL